MIKRYYLFGILEMPAVLTILLLANVVTDIMASGNDQIDALIDDLAHDDYPVRYRAHAELEAMGSLIGDYLRGMENHSNPEVRMRLKGIISSITLVERKLDWIDPEFRDSEKYWSGEDEQNVELTFINRLQIPINIFWVETNGRRRIWRWNLKPGESSVCKRSYMSHSWIIKDNKENYLGMYVIDRVDPIICVTKEDVSG